MRVCPHCHLLLGDAEASCPHDRTATAPASVPLPAPALASRFSDIVPFSQGPTGTSYRATHKQSGQAGLLRLVPLAPLEAAERVRLKRELRKQTKLAHDGLAHIVDGGEQGQDLWLFRELVAGETVSQRIARLGRMSVADTLAVTAQVATALDELQRGGLLHRDVKPSHIVLEPREGGHTMARLIDAGIAGRIDTGAVFDLLGTPAYISPEQVGGKLVSFRSDLYALGCVMFEMLTGRPPFEGPDVKSTLEAHRTKEVPALEVELPPAALSLLRSLLAKEPRQRPFSAQQVRRVLEPLLAPGTPLPAVSFRPAGASLPAKSPAQPDTSEELALEELDLQEQVTGTVALPPEEVDALVVHDSQPAGQLAAAAGARASTPQAAPVVAAAAAPSVAEPAATPAPDASPSPTKSPLPPVETPAAAAEVPPSRRSVDFDVESLFDDEVPAEPVAPTSLADTAPTQLYRRDAEGAGAMDIEPRAGGPVPEPEGPDPDATRVVTRPTAGRRPAWVPLAIAGVVLLAIVLWATSGDEEPQAAETAPGAGDSAAAAAPPAASAGDPGATAAPSAAAPGTVEPTAGPQGATVTAAPQPGTGGAAAGGPTAPSATAAPGAQPAPATGAGGAGAATNREAQAAAAAAPVQVEPAAAPGSEPAGDPALAPSGDKLGSSAGNRLSPQRDSRADRLAKAEELKLQARDHYKAGRFRDAAKAYEKATELNPQDAGAFAGLGASLLSNNDAKGAIDAYSKAVRLQPGSSGFHAALGRAYLSRGDRDRARAAYEKALQLNPENGAAKTALAQLK